LRFRRSQLTKSSSPITPKDRTGGTATKCLDSTSAPEMKSTTFLKIFSRNTQHQNGSIKQPCPITLRIGSVRFPVALPKSLWFLPLQPAPITRVLHDLHMRMQIFESSGVLFYIQFEDEMTIPLALEITKKTTGRSFTPRASLDRLGWPIPNQCRSIPNPPLQFEQWRCVALIARTGRPQIAIKFFERHPPVHTEPDTVIMLSDRELLTTPNSFT